MRYKFHIAFIILIIISLVDFSFYVKKELFYRYKYDLANIQNVSEFGDVEIIEATHSSIILSNFPNKLVPKHQYSIEFQNGKKFRFTFDTFKTKDNQTILEDVVWFFVKPSQTRGMAILREIKIPRNEKGTKKVAFLSEQLGCCLMNGKKMRYEWNKINRDLHFIGDKKDVYGYSYFGDTNIKTEGLIEIAEQITNNEVVVLWTGRNDGSIPAQKTLENIQATVRILEKNNPKSKIVLLYPAPSPNEQYDNRIKKVVDLLRQAKFNPEVLKIDLYQFIRDQNNWQNSLFYEEYGLTELAYKKIVKHINGEIFK